MKKHILIITTLILALALSACSKKGDGTKAEKKIEKKTEKPATETPAAPKLVTTASGLKYEILKKGDGPVPRSGQTCVVHYTGWLTDGKKFDSSVDRGKPFTFPVGQSRVIKGWDEGVLLMNVGSKYKFTIPSKLGYGARGAGKVIPPHADLVFEVELLEIK